MKEGDKNTQFFHRLVKVHTVRNKILRLQTDEGNWTNDYEEVKVLTVKFFENLFSESNPQSIPTQIWTGKTLNKEQANVLLTSITCKEIRDTLFSLKYDSVPGSDEYTVEFYKSNWTMVGDEFMAAIELFFTQNYLYYPINTTAISLIPKVESLVKMKEFRSICCCNVSYKILSKIIANRIKPLLPQLVDLNQSAFVKDRCIQDNILLMHNLVKSYQKIGGPSCCAIKVDIMKTFDTVKWGYLMFILKK